MPDLGVPTFTPSAADANAALVKGGYEAFARGDLNAVLALFDDDILWHVPGRGPLSRDYWGRDEVLGFFTEFIRLSGGSFRVQVDDILAKGDTVVVLATENAERAGRTWSSPQVHVWTLKNGRATRFWQYQGDQQGEDEFWSLAA
jgi:ketosteroid isomerase-like protein